MDRPYFIGPGGPVSTIAVNWHLKVKDIPYDAGLTKKYCIIVSMQKISLINIFLR